MARSNKYFTAGCTGPKITFAPNQAMAISVAVTEEDGKIFYEIYENGEVKFTINWEWLYGKLPSGTYRIFKQVDRQEISIEFNV